MFITLAAAFIAFLGGCGDKELDDGALDSQPTNDRTQSGAVNTDAFMIASVFPRTPMIARGGAATLTAIVTDGVGKTLESTEANPIVVKWSSSAPKIVRVSENGGIYGENLGSAIVTARAFRKVTKIINGATQIVEEVTKPYQTIVNVTKQNSSNVAELFFSPMRGYIDLGADRKFRLSAVDHAGTQAGLNHGTLAIVAESGSGNQVARVSPAELNLTDTRKEVEVTITGVREGFAFITPIYTISSEDYAETVRVTGTPLVVQVKASLETSIPNCSHEIANCANFDGGHYLSIAVGEEGGYKDIFATHYDRAGGKNNGGLVSSDFLSAWQHQTIAGGTGTGIDAGRAGEIALSPFEDNLNQPIALTLYAGKPAIYHKTTRGGWQYVPLFAASDRPIIEEGNESSYADMSSRLMSITSYRDAANPANSRVHIAYFTPNPSDPKNPKVCLISLSSPTTIVPSSSSNCLGAPPYARVHSVSIAHNRITGEPRFIYGYPSYSYANDGNESNLTEVSESLFYVSRQNGQFYRENITIDGNAGSAKIVFDRNNKPFVAMREGEHVRLYSREAFDNKYSWERDPSSVFNTASGRIASVGLALDSYNEPRLVYASDMGGGLKIHYMRKPPFRNIYSKNANRWVIEDPGQNDPQNAGDQGSSSAIAVDSANRAHLVYTLSGKKWFNYWAEPNFFDYRDYPAAQYSAADLITSNQAIK
jgi:hypothetical protein